MRKIQVFFGQVVRSCSWKPLLRRLASSLLAITVALSTAVMAQNICVPEPTVEVKPDGTKVITEPWGEVRTIKPDGTKVRQTKDGYTITTGPDGKATVTDKEGKTVTTPQHVYNSFGTRKIYHPDGTIQIDTAGESGSTFIRPDWTTEYPPDKRGLKVTVLPDGTIIRNYADGLKQTVRPDHSVTNEYPDGRKWELKSDGTTVEQSADGTQKITGKDGTVTTRNPDGSERTTKRDGTVTEKLKDGTERTKYPDGFETETKPDGTKISRYPGENGKTVTVAPDGTETVEYADGTTTIKFPNGVVVTTYRLNLQFQSTPEGTTTVNPPADKPAQDKAEKKPESQPKQPDLPIQIPTGLFGGFDNMVVTGDGESTRQISVTLHNGQQVPTTVLIDQGTFFVPNVPGHQVMSATAPVVFQLPPGGTVTRMVPSICADRKNVLPPGPEKKQGPKYIVGPHPNPALHEFMRMLPQVVHCLMEQHLVGNSQLSKDEANLIQQTAWCESGDLTADKADDVTKNSIVKEVLKQAQESTHTKPSAAQKQAVEKEATILLTEIDLCRKRTKELIAKAH